MWTYRILQTTICSKTSPWTEVPVGWLENTLGQKWLQLIIRVIRGGKSKRICNLDDNITMITYLQIWIVQYRILGKVNSRPACQRVSGPDCKGIGCRDLWSNDGRRTKNWRNFSIIFGQIFKMLEKYKNYKKQFSIMTTLIRILWKPKFTIIRTRCKFCCFKF